MVERILVHSLVNIGDVLLSTSGVALLRQAYPKARIAMMVRPVAVGLLENNPLVDEIIVYDYKAKTRSPMSLWRMAQELRQKKFDLCVSFDRKLRPALLAWLAGIPVRVGPEKVFDDVPSRVTWLYTHVIPICHSLNGTLQAETYQAIVRGYTGIAGKGEPAMAIPTAAQRQKAAELFQELGEGPGKKIALCVKGTFALKTWPKERFAALADILHREYGAALFIVGAPEDRAYGDEVIGAAAVPIANWCGRTSLPELAAVLGMSDMLITVDTGATHIAATTKIPMVVMYGCTSPDRWHPINPKARVLTSREECCPCSIPEDACSHRRCLTAISVEAVLAAAKEFL